MIKSIGVMASSLLLTLILSASATLPATHGRSYLFTVLDGDTVVVDGSAVHVAGIDAPELGPWARCWAEAALAGHSRLELQRLLVDSNDRGWDVRAISAPDSRGTRTGRFLDRDGYDIVDEMVVGGYAAQTDAKWDWCGNDANLHQVSDDEPAPHGPSLWWPTAHMYDARAAD